MKEKDLLIFKIKNNYLIVYVINYFNSFYLVLLHILEYAK